MLKLINHSTNYISVSLLVIYHEIWGKEKDTVKGGGTVK